MTPNRLGWPLGRLLGSVEAISNVVRHSGARTCQVRLGTDSGGQLVVEVCTTARVPGRGRPGAAVLVLTMFEDYDMVFSAVSAGAVGYLLKGAGGADIVTAVRAAGVGQAVFGAALAQRLRTWFTRGPQAADPFPQLTVREREILDGVATGLTNAQIGQQMFLSPKTVANNVSNILAKLQLGERGQAIVAARDAGLGRRPGGEPERS